MAFMILLAAAVVILIWFLTSNSVVSGGKTKCEEARGYLETYLVQREEFLFDMARVAEGFAKHESESLMAILSSIRGGNIRGREDRLAVEHQITSILARITVIAECSGTMDADPEYAAIQSKINNVEESIQNTGAYYNDCVKRYNLSLTSFLGSKVARWRKLEPLPEIELKADAGVYF